MTTFQKIDSSDNLIPNGDFCQGTGYWEEDPLEEFRFMRHLKFFQNHEGATPLNLGEPKYGLFSRRTCWCWLNRNDLFTYPIRQYRKNFRAIPIDRNRLIVSKVRSDDFLVEGIDDATAYSATLDTGGNLSIVIERSVFIPVGVKIGWLQPNKVMRMLVTDSEGTPGIDYRTFKIHAENSQPITSADVGNGVSTINFWVRKIVQKGSTAVLTDLADTATGYYNVEESSADELTLFKQGETLQVKAQPGDVEGIVYTYNPSASPSLILTMQLRVFGSLAVRGVAVGDYFVMMHPYKAYGRISSLSTQPDGSEQVYVEVVKGPPETGVGTYVAATDWVISPGISCDLEVQIPGVQYDLTIAFTHRAAFNWDIFLDFVTEEGASINDRRTIDALRAFSVRSFPVVTGSSYTRRTYKISIVRPLPVPGLPRIRFFRPSGGGDLEISDVVMLRGNLSGTEYNESSPADIDELLYIGAPDGGLIPKGTVVPFIGGASCPPGWRDVVGHPNDAADPPGSVEFVFPTFEFDKIVYNSTKDITTIGFSSTSWDLSKDGFSYYPWSAYKVLLPVTMRPAPRPPVYSFKIRVDGYTVTLFSVALPAPPGRPQRYEYVEVGMLKPRIGSALTLQVIPNAKTSLFEPNSFPYRPNSMYNILIAEVRVMTEFRAYEEGSDTDPSDFRATYPSGYNDLYNELNFNAGAPTPDGITTLINLLNNLYQEISRVALYDPRRLGEPLPAVRASEVVRDGEESALRVTEIDLVGDWRQALGHAPAPKARIIRSGYVKVDTEQPGLSGIGAEQHNHEVMPTGTSPITGVSAKVSNMSSSDVNRPPIPANHGHGYLGAGGYSRPLARAVKLCEKL